MLDQPRVSVRDVFRIPAQAILTATVFALGIGDASAYNITISTKPTKEVKCTKGKCEPTGLKAILNVTDLGNLLKTRGTKMIDVLTGNNGTQPGDVIVATALKWSTKTSLTFDAYHSIRFNARVTAAGRTAFNLIINDGSTNGTLVFSNGGGVTIENLSTALTIDGQAYALADTVGGLASAVTNNPTGLIAFAGNYDASQDGTYSASPVQTKFTGTLEGFGNTISNLSVNDPTSSTTVGLFSAIGTGGTVKDLTMSDADIAGNASNIGSVAGANYGTVLNFVSSGLITGTGDYANAGGIVGENESGAIVINSYSQANVTGTDFADSDGGLVGYNSGLVSSSFATGAVSNTNPNASPNVGGAIGTNEYGTVTNCYATGSVTGGGSGDIGGLIGNDFGSEVSYCYSTGAPLNGKYMGGFIGNDGSSTLTDDYWDTTTSGITDPSQGAGNESNDPGITGLTTTQFQSGSPTGFSDVVWSEDSTVNNGLPYLISNPPPKKKNR